MKKSVAGLLLFISLLTLWVAPCFAGDVNLSVAASLKDAMNELSDGFVKKNPGARLVRNYGGSGTLAKQIENGAPSDLFISANREWMDYLQKRTLVDVASVRLFAYNALVFAGNPANKVTGMQDLAKLDRIAIGSPRSVPAGEYAVEAMKRAGVDRLLERKLVMARDVRECLMYAERGEVDGAFVYRTDALLAKQAKILFTVPQSLYPQVVYPMALTVSGAKNKDAAAFFRYLQGGEARRVLGKYGFTVR